MLIVISRETTKNIYLNKKHGKETRELKWHIRKYLLNTKVYINGGIQRRKDIRNRENKQQITKHKFYLSTNYIKCK